MQTSAIPFASITRHIKRLAISSVITGALTTLLARPPVIIT